MEIRHSWQNTSKYANRVIEASDKYYCEYFGLVKRLAEPHSFIKSPWQN